jgi:hypothetical protein
MRTTRAGLPTTTAYSGTDFVTTAPAPTIEPRPIVMPGRMVAPPPDRSAGLNSRHRKSGRILLTARVAVVGEGHVGADENVVLDTETIPELHAGFHRNAISNHHIILNEAMRTDIAAGTNLCTRKDDYVLPYFSIYSNILYH